MTQVWLLSHTGITNRSITFCYFIYPDNCSSLRFEKLIEGIQQYEKLCIRRDGPVGVETVTTKENRMTDDKNVYDLTGRKVKKGHGVYILNGKKTLIK